MAKQKEVKSNEERFATILNMIGISTDHITGAQVWAAAELLRDKGDKVTFKDIENLKETYEKKRQEWIKEQEEQGRRLSQQQRQQAEEGSSDE